MGHPLKPFPIPQSPSEWRPWRGERLPHADHCWRGRTNPRNAHIDCLVFGGRDKKTDAIRQHLLRHLVALHYSFAADIPPNKSRTTPSKAGSCMQCTITKVLAGTPPCSRKQQNNQLGADLGPAQFSAHHINHKPISLWLFDMSFLLLGWHTRHQPRQE